jgi:hypothetical protein
VIRIVTSIYGEREKVDGSDPSWSAGTKALKPPIEALLLDRCLRRNGPDMDRPRRAHHLVDAVGLDGLSRGNRDVCPCTSGAIPPEWSA